MIEPKVPVPSQESSHTGAGWELRLDGVPRMLSRTGGQLVLERRDAAMLAYLALEGPTARERLLGMLWPQEAQQPLRGRLRQRVFALKRKFGAEVVEGGLALTLGAAIRWAGLAIGPDDKPPFEHDDFQDLPELAEWLAALRERQQSLQRDRLAEQATVWEQDGQWGQAIALAERLVALQPLQEHAHCRLMRLHYLRGDRSAALAAFDHCEQVLKDELGARPSPATLTLLAQIEASGVLKTTELPRDVPVTVLRPPVLVGREAPWRQLQSAWQSLQAVVLLGEAGLGKSRLLVDLASAHGLAQGRVVMVSARPGDERVTYAVLVRLLRALLSRGSKKTQAPWVAAELSRLLPELSPQSAPTGQSHPARLLGAVESLIRQARDDGLDALILDDLHFCDAASIEVAQQLAAATTGVRWLVAMRGAEVSPEVHAYIDELVGTAHAQTIVLQPLDREQIAELLDSLQIPGIQGRALAGPLHQRTGGNVLYLLETLKTMVQHSASAQTPLDRAALSQLPVAPNVGRLIEQRLNRLSPAVLRLVRCAAIAGADFSAPLAVKVLGVGPLDLADSWAELESAQVLRDGAFAHDLIYEAVLAAVPSAIAMAFHAEVAAWLQSQQADPSRTANHWQLAQRWLPAGQAWAQAAAVCGVQGRRAEQARCLTLAADCYREGKDLPRRMQTLLERAATLVQYEISDQARLALDQLEQEIDGGNNHDAYRLKLLSLRMAYANLVGEFDLTLALAPQAIALARALGDQDEIFTTTNQWCGALTKSYRAGEAIAQLQALQAWVLERASNEQRYEYWNGLALALDFNNQLPESLPAWQASCDVAQAMDSDLLPQALNNMAYTCAKMGHHERAVVLARRALTLNTSRGDDFDQAGLGQIIRFSLGHHLRNLGCYREAIELMEQAASAFEAARSPMLLAAVQHQLAVVWVQLGQFARAQPLVSADLPEQTDVQQAQRLAFRALVLGAQGRAADDVIRRALALVPNPDSLAHRMWTLVATALVEPPQGEAMAIGVAAWARQRQRLGMALAAHVRAARCALAQGDWQRAVPQVQQALGLPPDVQPDLLYLPELWWVAAQVYAAAGQTDERRQAVLTGVQWIQRIAREHVPQPFQESFLQRNPVNAQLLAWGANVNSLC